jgi:hypothetical protein
MCHFKSWYLDEYGYVVKSERCNYLQVCFGTLMLTLSEMDYEIFAALVSRKKEDHIPMHDPNIRCVLLPTPSGIVHGVLSEKELDQLHKMLQEADNEMKAQQLIGLFAE